MNHKSSISKIPQSIPMRYHTVILEDIHDKMGFLADAAMNLSDGQERIEKRLERVETRLNHVELQLGNVETELGEVKTRLDDTETVAKPITI